MVFLLLALPLFLLHGLNLKNHLLGPLLQQPKRQHLPVELHQIMLQTEQEEFCPPFKLLPLNQ
jgi:hypothetical protein